MTCRAPNRGSPPSPMETSATGAWLLIRHVICPLRSSSFRFSTGIGTWAEVAELCDDVDEVDRGKVVEDVELEKWLVPVSPVAVVERVVTLGRLVLGNNGLDVVGRSPVARRPSSVRLSPGANVVPLAGRLPSVERRLLDGDVLSFGPNVLSLGANDRPSLRLSSDESCRCSNANGLAVVCPTDCPVSSAVRKLLSLD